MTETAAYATAVQEPTPMDPTRILDVDPLPAGFSSDHLDRIPIPRYSDRLKGEGPIDVLDAVQQLHDAGERVNRRFDRAAMEQDAADALRTFKAAGLVQGIQTLPAHALRAKEEAIAAQQEADTREAQAAHARWRAVSGRLLFEARAAAIAKPIERHAAQNPTDHLAAVRDLLEQDRAD